MQSFEKMTDINPTQVTIDLSAIRHNYREIRRIVPEDQRVLCVIKSNAYGHGLVEVAKALVIEEANFFGVRDVEEGRRLREAGIECPILILLGLIADAFEQFVGHQLTPTIYDLETARAFNHYLEQQGLVHKVHVKIDTGMTRLGVPATQISTFMEELNQLTHLKVEGVLSHLAEASDPAYTATQKEAWDQACTDIKAQNADITLWHFANSIGAVKNLFPHNNMVRAGIVLYGCYPDESLRDQVTLKPTLQWTSRIIDLKTVPAGTSVSYGCTYTTQRESRIAVIPLGYADGYPRLLSNRSAFLIHGQRAPIAGRVCMDLTMVDVTDIPDVAIGDTVTVLGQGGTEQITADDLASWAETINYEIITRIAGRVPRAYKE